MTTASDKATDILKIEEGFRPKPYYDTLQIPTYGYGFVCGNKYAPLPAIEINEKDAAKRLNDLILVNEKTFNDNPDLSVCYTKCNDVRRAVLLSIAHQIGIYGVLKFKKMIAALSNGDFNLTADCLLDSLAARQTPERWHRNANMMRSGELDSYYASA